MSYSRWGVSLFVAVCLLFAIAPAAGQAQCGAVERIGFPVDVAAFQLVQDFGIASQRHQGRYHTGEDWHGGRGSSFGQPVYAIANGRVTYSYPIAWGRDGGVVIVEHTFPDGSLAYSVYGHLVELGEEKLPPQLSCVAEGDLIGYIGEARPAPHLHFEIKTANPNSPGPGYTRENPVDLGWLNPSQFINDWQFRLGRGYAWGVELDSERLILPVELSDHSLIYLDSGVLRRVTLDGRILWRVVLEQPVAGLANYQDGALIIYADGSTQPVSLDGTLTPGWTTEIALESPVMPAGDTLLFRTPDNSLIAFDSTAQTRRWSLGLVPPIRRWHFSGRLFGFITDTDELIAVSPGGEYLDRAQLRAGGALGTAPNGDLMVYTSGGLWTVDSAGAWGLYIEDAPPGGESAAFAWDIDNRLYLFDGAVLTAYDAARAVAWQIALPGIRGQTALDVIGANLLLVSSAGDIIAVEKNAGGVCNLGKIDGSPDRLAWHSQGSDGILRVATARQIVGLDWARFLTACAP